MASAKTQLKILADRFGVSEPVDSGVRSNKTLKPGRLARKVWEQQGGIRSAVIGPKLGPPGLEGNLIGRTGPEGGIHANAIENALTARYGKNIPDKIADETWDAYGRGENFMKRMGFTTRNERWISREEATRRAKERNPALGKHFEEHSGGMQIDRIQREGEIGTDALLGEERRAPGESGERIKRNRARALEQIKKLDLEEADLKRKNIMKTEGGVTSMVKQQKPRLRHSPSEFAYNYSNASTTEKNQMIAKRLKVIDARRQVLKKGVAGDPTNTGLLAKKSRIVKSKVGYEPFKMVENNPKPVEPLIKNEPLHVKADRQAQELKATREAARVRVNSPTPKVGKLGKLVRKLKGGSMRAVGPMSFLTEPGATVEAVKDIFSGDSDRQMKAAEYFQGLPERSTGRGYTEKEKREMILPWYDPSRREGGI